MSALQYTNEHTDTHSSDTIIIVSCIMYFLRKVHGDMMVTWKGTCT